MVKRQFLKMVKIRMLSLKMSRDIVDQIVSELDATFELGRARGKKDVEIISDMGGVGEVASNYAKKFGYIKKGYSTPDIDVSSKKFTGLGRKKSYETSVKSYSETIDNRDFVGKAAESTNKTFENIENTLSGKLESIKNSIPIPTQGSFDTGTSKTDNKPKSTFSPFKLVPILFLIVSLSGIGNLFFDSDTTDQDTTKYDEPFMTEEFEQDFSKVKINAKNVNVRIKNSGVSHDHKNSIAFMGEDNDNYMNEVSYGIEGDTLNINVNEENTMDVYSIELYLENSDQFDVDLEADYGFVQIDNDLKNLKLKSKDSSVYIYSEELFDMDIESATGDIDIMSNEGDANVIASSVSGTVTITDGETYTGKDLPEKYLKNAMSAKYKNSKYKVKILSDGGNIELSDYGS